MFEVIGSWKLPIREVSGLCVRQNGSAELLAIGDARWEVAVAELTSTGVHPLPTTQVGRAINRGRLSTRGSSEFEGIATDGSGRVFLLQERSGRVLVLDHAMTVLEHSITLDVSPEDPEIGEAWHQDANARGEGLLLLRGGHMLIAKQRNPVRLIEFGPAGDAPLGFAVGGALAAAEPFTLPDGDASTVDVLATWSLDPAAAIASINDLAVDAEGRLHFVSSRSRCLGRLDADLKPGEDDVATTVLALPPELSKHRTEGLVFTDGLGWLVALDRQEVRPNLHRIVPDRTG
jgi:hypothetical protein